MAYGGSIVRGRTGLIGGLGSLVLSLLTREHPTSYLNQAQQEQARTQEHE